MIILFSTIVTENQKKEFDELTYISIILHLSDSILWNVGNMIQLKIFGKSLKSFTWQFMSYQLFLLKSFKIHPLKKLVDNSGIFNKQVQDITNCVKRFSMNTKQLFFLMQFLMTIRMSIMQTNMEEYHYIQYNDRFVDE